MRAVPLDLSGIKSWSDFHDAFSRAFSFPHYYGRNMDAWIDCMGDALSVGDGLTVIQISGARELKRNAPEILEALNECAAFVNFRESEAGNPAIVALDQL